jgi:8-oxo-dGTP diphosphatase
VTEIVVVGAAVLRDGRCLVARRGRAMTASLLWEFPGGKVEAGEAPEGALVRELREELGIDVTVGALLGACRTPVAGGVVRLSVYEARIVGGTAQCREHDAIDWVDADGLARLEWAAPDVPIVPQVAARLRRDDARRGAR